MTRKRLMTGLLAGGLMIGMLPSVASATRPDRGCSQTFVAMTILEFRAYLNSDAFLTTLSPEGLALAPDILSSINTPGWVAGAEKIDANDDQILCLKQKPPTKGNLYGWIFNGVDNTANH